ncbi:hypothetical protein [Phormidium nigroviride]
MFLKSGLNFLRDIQLTIAKVVSDPNPLRGYATGIAIAIVNSEAIAQQPHKPIGG